MKTKRTLLVAALSFGLLCIVYPSFNLSYAQNNPTKQHASNKHYHHAWANNFPLISTIKSTKDTPILWTRLRAQFSLKYPSNHPRVQKYIREFTHSPAYLKQLSQKAQPFLFFIVEEIEKRGLPGEIALLPMIESTFEPTANSKSGAQGLWQIMPATGALYNLKQDAWHNGLKDVYTSTIAAQNHLLALHKRFSGDWLLALAAYNSGEGKILCAIKFNQKHHLPTDFWSLKLPQETRNYVPKLLALINIIKSPATYHVILPPIENRPFFSAIKVTSQIDFRTAAKLTGISQKEIIQLNPGYYRHITSNLHPSYLLLPQAHVEKFERQLKKISTQGLTIKAHYHTIRAGESLSVIAKEYQTTISELKKINNLTSSTIHPGKSLLLPSHV